MLANMTDVAAPILDVLTDALARGRVTVAEAAGIAQRELEAWFELACVRLDTGRYADAATLLAALVTVFPYSGKYWRAYGIALHIGMQLRRALAAYDIALKLEPDHVATQCYRAEIWLYMGDTEAALTALQRTADGSDARMARRASALLRFMEHKNNQEAVLAVLDSEAPIPDLPPGHLTMADGRALPLTDSVLTAPPTGVTDVFDDPTHSETTARIFLDVRTVHDLATDERTDTAIIPGRRVRRGAPEPANLSMTTTGITNTAVVARPSAVTDPATLPLRTAMHMRRDGASLTDEVTLSRVVGLPSTPKG